MGHMVARVPKVSDSSLETPESKGSLAPHSSGRIGENRRTVLVVVQAHTSRGGLSPPGLRLEGVEPRLGLSFEVRGLAHGCRGWSTDLEALAIQSPDARDWPSPGHALANAGLPDRIRREVDQARTVEIRDEEVDLHVRVGHEVSQEREEMEEGLCFVE